MKTLEVGLKEKSYEICIGTQILGDAGKRIKPFVSEDASVAVIADENTWSFYGESLIKALASEGIEPKKIILKPGESSKNIQVVSSIYDALGKDGGFNRSSLLIALGGGVVGDITGFAAATWMRGINYIQIPTTLLAQVDSSVGGKTAIDTESGKNLVGAFHQPKFVLIDTQLLTSLPSMEFNSGMAEVIKYGVISSQNLFEKLESINIDSGNNNQGIEEADIVDIVYECCDIKRRIVEEDEFDSGIRMILNFGHTFGHAIEVKHGFEKYTHGEAVAQGMLLAAAVGTELGITKGNVTERILELINKFSLPTPKDFASLIEYMKLDKKASADKARMILVEEIGKADVYTFTYSEIKDALEKVSKQFD